MDKVVVDSSVAIKWFIAEPHSSEARRILNDYKAGTLDLLAPDLINAEIGNIVWKKQTFQGLAPEHALQIIDAFRGLAFEFVPTAILLDDAYRLAATHRCTVYDALYLALSVRERCPLITADEQLVNTFQTVIPSTTWVGNWSPA